MAGMESEWDADGEVAVPAFKEAEDGEAGVSKLIAGSEAEDKWLTTRSPRTIGT